MSRGLKLAVMCSGLLEPLVEEAARTLYETDEDITDEGISSLVAKGRSRAWQEARTHRQTWDEMTDEVQSAYRRRVRAVFALVANSIPTKAD